MSSSVSIKIIRKKNVTSIVKDAIYILDKTQLLTRLGTTKQVKIKLDIFTKTIGSTCYQNIMPGDDFKDYEDSTLGVYCVKNNDIIGCAVAYKQTIQEMKNLTFMNTHGSPAWFITSECVKKNVPELFKMLLTKLVRICKKHTKMPLFSKGYVIKMNKAEKQIFEDYKEVGFIVAKMNDTKQLGITFPSSGIEPLLTLFVKK